MHVEINFDLQNVPLAAPRSSFKTSTKLIQKCIYCYMTTGVTRTGIEQ